MALLSQHLPIRTRRLALVAAAPWRILRQTRGKTRAGLLILVPILGWTGVSAYGARGTPFGFQLPEILPQNGPLGETILYYHGWAAIGLGLLALMHIGAALMHRFIIKDGVFARMWPGSGDKGQA